MKKLKIILLVIFLTIVLSLTALFFLGYFKAKGAGLVVNTTPSSTVFIDGLQAGRTPYKAALPPKDIVLRLVPDAAGSPLALFETKLSLNPGIETIVNREFGETDAASAGEIVSFEKVGRSEAGLSIISIPDAAQISIDGQVRGFAPYKPPSILAGEHRVVISAPGYNARTLQVKTREGYRLIIVAKLSVNPGEKSSDKVQDLTEEKVVYVEILATPTGFLRVRQEASTSSAEIGQVKPGEKYELVEETENWYKITFKTGDSPERSRMGWISAQYAKKLEETTPSPSPSPTGSPKPTVGPTATPSRHN